VSKAFTRESDDRGEQEAGSLRAPLLHGMRNFITRKGAEGLRRRLDALLETRRASGANQVAGTDQWRVESDIRKLQAILDSAVIAEIPADQGKVAFGASVTIRHENGEQDEYQIVGVDEADPAAGRISWISPLARALLSREVGDKVPFKSPAGFEELAIVKVHYPGN
jgi:transcription elongation factor GreB